MSPNRIPVIFLMTVLFSRSAQAQQSLPADRQATRETIHLFHYLQMLPSRGFLFGHQDDLAYGVGWKYIPGRSDIRDVTGDYPALYGWELGRIELDHAVNLDSVSFDYMKEWIREGYSRGGIITISWHLNNPLTGGTAWEPAPGTVASILPGGEKHSLYTHWLDKVGAFFLSLKGSRQELIPIIFRPFHELNGSWFWWGGKNCQPDEIKALYRFTVSYLRDTLHVHNLLYAYNTDRFHTATDYLLRYPGDEWVDIAGFDIYQGNTIAKNENFISELSQTLTILDSICTAHHKIPALTEFGYNGLPDSTWWTQVLLRAIGTHPIAYALAWRNAGGKSATHFEFYVPYKGQASAKDFVKFYEAPQTLFQKDLRKERIYE